MGAAPYVPFGYIAAILLRNGHAVQTATEAPSDGVMVVAPSLVNFKGDLATIKQGHARAGVYVIVVGHLATVRPEDFLPYADLVVRGEPESLFQTLQGDTLPSGVINAETIQDLDSLPFPDWTVCNTSRASFSFAFREKNYAFVQGSRSCPYTCGYCPYISTTSYRQRSVQSVVQELRHLQSGFDVGAVVFRDPVFTLNRKWVVAFCAALEAEGLQISWECETRLDRLDSELLDLMQRAGLKSIKVGIESSDPQILRDVARRPTALIHQEKIIEDCRRLGVSVVAFYVLGLPTDDEQSVQRTVSYAKMLNTDIARFHLFTPLPGTPLYESVKDRIIESDWEKFDLFHVVFDHPALSKQKLLRLKENAYVSYSFRWS
jgi:radical SAM superfamily enzyme YgiQ (UPF0313 family)